MFCEHYLVYFVPYMNTLLQKYLFMRPERSEMLRYSELWITYMDDVFPLTLLAL